MNGLRMLWLAIAGGALGAFAGIGLPCLDAGIAAAVGAAVGAALGAASGALDFRRRPKRPEASAAASAATLRLREERLDIRKERVVT
ncbi:MAG TPA: hypothetical protein VEZ72_24660, partial [Paenibacillus sp.]|nr:hypothetical protein [Paenibacillus sp.]